MLGLKMRPVAVSVLVAAFAFNLHSRALAATIFLPVSVSGHNIPPDAIKAPARIAAPARASAEASSSKLKQPQPDTVPTMWASLTGSFALVGMVLRRRRRSPSVTS